MARTAITPVSPLGAYGDYSVAEAADITMNPTTGLTGNDGNEFVASGNDLVIVHNTQAGAQTITFTSVNDPYNRSGDITTYSIGIDEHAIFGPFNVAGWRQTDNNVYFETSHADVLVAVVAL